MAEVMVFPREFEKNFWRDLNKEMLVIFVVTFLILNSFTYYMSLQPVKEVSPEQVSKYAEVIYRVKATTTREVKREVATTGGAVEEKAPVQEEVKEEAPKTAVDREAQVAAERAKRKAAQEAKRAAIAERVKILAGPTARGGRARSRAAGGGTIGLTEGGGGFDIKGMVGMVGEAGLAEKVKKLRGGGAIGEDIGDIDIAALKAMSADDLNLMLSQAPVDVSRSKITATGKGSRTKQRSQAAISDVVLQNKNQVQYCYWAYKRRDANLKGRVVVEFTIAPSGEVVRVRFRESNWGGNRLGEEVERCITNILMQWHFDPIAQEEGNVTAGATYIFE